MASNSQIACTILTGPRELENLSGEWLALLDRSLVNEPTLTPAWLLTWWEVFGGAGGRQLNVAVFRDGPRLIGLAPLLCRKHMYRGRLPFQRIELLGTGEDTADEICSDYSNVVAERGAEEDVCRALVQALSRGQLGRWDELIVPMAAGDQGFSGKLIQSFDSASFMTSAQIVNSSPYIPLPSTWDEYLQTLSSDNRYYLNRSMRDFNNWAGGEIEFKCASNPEELADGKRILMDLHSERWRGDGKPGVFTSSRFREFHDKVMPILLAEKALELAWLEVRGEPIAALYNIVWNGKVYSYQSGRKLTLPRGLRPGVVVHSYAIRQAIQMGRREYDFLAGESQFKRKLSLAARPLIQIRVARKSFVECARLVAEAGISRTRNVRRLFGQIWDNSRDRATASVENAYGGID
ncbi:MAG TPA: GNAT family N-acetyltransferase [Blastocatellia bacterium]|nr:GNAT family N-acetyltransferase [Blastocatellia bacterium]